MVVVLTPWLCANWDAVASKESLLPEERGSCGVSVFLAWARGGASPVRGVIDMTITSDSISVDRVRDCK